jgi:hypothetical protein
MIFIIDLIHSQKLINGNCQMYCFHFLLIHVHKSSVIHVDSERSQNKSRKSEGQLIDMKDMNKLNEDQWKTTQVKRNEMRGTDMK